MIGNSRTADIQLGGHSDFLEFGGDSLLAPQTLSQMETVFGTSVSIRRFFSAPTVARLAREVDGQRRSARVSTRTPRSEVRRNLRFPVSRASRTVSS